MVVTKVEGNKVIINLNHPLAGVTLNFDIQIVNVREATQEELDHSHMH